ncbi:pseudouridine synthase [Candidatus Nanosynbacter sp. BB002]|jgi:pseudouridylate synthase|uniref:pseudouridine synthase n=1 Tax=Candidatus Nanosynbacter sp. BB002 TaxID=3393757 RepID=UPI0030D3536E
MPDNTTPTHEPTQRLNKFVALALGVSRRQADELIEQGTVTVNDQPAQLGQRITTADIIRYDNKPLTAQTHQLILLHKPVGYLCSRASQGGVPTIYELLPKDLHHLKPVGRLDKDSSGLILLTNDGDFAHQMTHPSFYKIKRYLVTLDQPLQPLHRQMINDFGVQLPDGPSRLTLERQHDGDNHRWIVQMSEGRNRQIRRTFAALGYTVTKLHRTDFGNYTLGNIKRGEFQESNLTADQ